MRFWLPLLCCLVLVSGCVRHSDEKLLQNNITVDRVSERYGVNTWYVECRVFNRAEHQMRVLIRAGVDFADENLSGLAQQIVGERLLTLQTNESRVVRIPLAEQSGVRVDWKTRLFAEREPIVWIVGSGTYY